MLAGKRIGKIVFKRSEVTPVLPTAIAVATWIILYATGRIILLNWELLRDLGSSPAARCTKFKNFLNKIRYPTGPVLGQPIV